MNEILLTSNAEKLAEHAESLKAFSGLKLLHVKREVASILGQIGREGIFDEYTKHDISHIDHMLDSLDWLIPTETQENMTPSDWLMITLSIYFHDLGMLVTKREFQERSKSGFPKYKQAILDGANGLDYRDKILNLDGIENQDRFIYQELVRKTHAERIKLWILDEPNINFPNELQITKEIKLLIANIDLMFRRDLGMICESHHLSDLEDFEKYKLNQQYGPSKSEIVNLHYSALLLRTADLLHITSDRTPSIEYKLINPSDPLSQEEWAKQKAVKTIRPKEKKNKEGMVDHAIPKDTLEIIAFFEEEKGFFGLVSYIDYANKQLKENFKFNESANKLSENKYYYPWKNIDDTSIETKDFEKRQFEFILDQTKILDLLVGHTLYNDSSVVLRELTQNAIDAVKLKKHELEMDKLSSTYVPEIKISWNEKSRELTFIDNGTGMTLEIIQNHLLKVGSSRYQDESFKKKYPNFTPISRFGIGLLTCFLIADDIDIITKASENDKGILLKIKKIHGKYLLKYLTIDKLDPNVKQHGTTIRLYVRADVNLSKIDFEIKRWILIPNCAVKLQINETITDIGYSSPGEFLKSYLNQIGYIVDDKKIKIKEVMRNGITVAFALHYLEHWKEWDFMEYQELNKNIITPIGTCIEGIRVDFNTPGFTGRNLYALVNTSGKNGPKTNVARSNIELTPEREALLSTIYLVYLEHVTDQLQNLIKSGFSITWASKEANWLLRTITRNLYHFGSAEIKIEDKPSFQEALSNIQCVLIEKQEKREVISINDLKILKHFWSIDCVSYLSADSLVKEVKSSNTSALTLLKMIIGKEDSNTAHIDYLLCNQESDPFVDRIIRDSFQVDAIKIIPEQRRLDLRWSLIEESIWEEIMIPSDEFGQGSRSRCYIQLLDVEIDDSISQIAISSSNALFILKNSELNRYLVKLIGELTNKSHDDKRVLEFIIGIIDSLFYYIEINKNHIEEYIQSRFQRVNSSSLEKLVWSRVSKSELISTIVQTNFIKYDTTVWYRRDS